MLFIVSLAMGLLSLFKGKKQESLLGQTVTHREIMQESPVFQEQAVHADRVRKLIQGVKKISAEMPGTDVSRLGEYMQKNEKGLSPDEVIQILKKADCTVVNLGPEERISGVQRLNKRGLLYFLINGDVFKIVKNTAPSVRPSQES